MHKKVLITGSTKGIGREVAIKFHSLGWDVCISGRDSNEVLAVVGLLNDLRPKSCIGLRAELGVTHELNRLVEFIGKEWRNLDSIVFNIGSGSGIKGINLDFEENQSILCDNFINIVKTFKFLIPLVRIDSSSSIIFVGSIAQKANVNAPLAYSYSKRALNLFARAQSIKYAPQKILINVINPGHILTSNGIWEKKKQNSIAQFEKFVSENIPVGKMIRPEELAEFIALYATSASNGHLVGQRIDYDGGTSITF